MVLTGLVAEGFNIFFLGYVMMLYKMHMLHRYGRPNEFYLRRKRKNIAAVTDCNIQYYLGIWLGGISKN
jgi:hypothetical protein